MLSRKYLAIKKGLTGLSTIGIVNRKMLVLANMYLDIEKGHRFSYLSDENGETNLLDALAKKYEGRPFVYFDVGAHVGTYTDMVVERFADYQGHLFDLSPATLDFCRQVHGADKNLVINHLALTDTVGEVEYRFYPKTHMQNGISGVRALAGYESELRTAPGATGDHYCETQNIGHIDLLKIDTEGYDLHVLRGFDRMLSQNRVDVLQFEYNIKSSETRSMLGDFYAFLEARGYRIGALRQDGVKFAAFDFKQNDFHSGPNYVACLPQFCDGLAAFKTGAA